MRAILAALAFGSIASCAQATPPAQQAGGPVMVSATAPALKGAKLDLVTAGLDAPWGMAWLPDGSILVTEKAGLLRIIRGGVLQKEPVNGTGAIAEIGQGGFMDVAVDPDFASTGHVFFTVATGDRSANATVVVRAKFDGKALSEWTEIWRNPIDKQGGQHFGSRILFLADKTMFVAIGDGGNPPASLDGAPIRNKAQDRNFAFGKVLRMDRDGQPLADNPFFAEGGTAAYVWTLGHRNIQGLAIDPATGTVWAHEHGARGGDEINILTKGANYGWPLVTYSREYAGPEISIERSRAGMVDPLLVWTPSIGPSGFAIKDGVAYVGALVNRQLQILALDASKGAKAPEGVGAGARVRDARLGPDGNIYILTDEGGTDGRLLKLLVTR